MFRFGLLLLPLACLLACADPEERFQAHLERSARFAHEQRLEDALIELQNALALQPQNAEVNQRMAELLVQLGNTGAAAIHFGDAYRLDPDRADAALRQIRLLRTSQPALAEQILADVAARHPDHAPVHRAEAQLALLRGQPERALAAAERSVQLAPGSPQSWLQLGLAQRMRAEATPEPDRDTLEAAIAAFERADELAEGHVAARVERAQLLAQHPERHGEAIEGFRGALALCRERELPGRRRAAALAFEQFARQRGAPDLLEEALREQVEAQPERLDAWLRLADARAGSGGEQAAVAVLDEMMRAWPGSPAALVAAAGYAAERGRLDAAVARLEGAVEKGVDDPLVWEQLVRLELGAGRLAAARARAMQLDRRHPGHPLGRRSAARLALAERRIDDALALLEGPEPELASPETELLRAQIELERGHLGAARSALQRALAGGFSEPARRLDAVARARAGEWTEAIAALDDLRARGYALTPAERTLLARAHYERGEAQRGRRVLRDLFAAGQAPPEAALEYARREARGDPEGARARLEEAAARHPAHLGLIEALTRLDLPGRAGAALARLDAALAAGHADARLLVLRAEVLAASGRLARAEADAMRALEVAPQLPRALDVAHAILRARGRVDAARLAFAEAEAEGALHDGARVLLARLELAAGDAASARATYERVLAESPHIAAARNDLAFLLASRGEELPRAQRLAVEAQRAMPGSANASDTLGYVLLRLGHAEAAAEQFRSALEQALPGDPSLPTFHYHLALAAVDLERPRVAARELRRALALSGDFPGAEDARARLARIEQTLGETAR